MVGSIGRAAVEAASGGAVRLGGAAEATVASGRASSEERIQSSMARSSPPTHLRRTSVDPLGATETRCLRLRSGRRIVPTHFSTICSESGGRRTEERP